jgi:polyisoprenyl-phosphate glycosyltransferase
MADPAERAPVLSVVLPVYDEAANLRAVVTRLAPVLEKLTQGSWEIVFADDGSKDGSSDLLDTLHGEDARVKVLHLSRNFGHQAALSAGLEAASGQAVVLMDADLQDPPEVIDAFVERWRAGFDVVYAVRRTRKEGIFKRAAYAVFYLSMRRLANIDVPVDAGDFCLLDRAVVDELVALPERQRFLRGLRAWVGFRQTGVEYDRDARAAGASKYSLGKLVQLAVSGYVGFSAFPLRASAWLGFAAAFTGFALAIWAIASKLLGLDTPQGWASTVAIVLFLGGVQLLVLGVIGEYLGRVYDEVRARPTYIVRRRLGFTDNVVSAETRRSARSRTSEPPA